MSLDAYVRCTCIRDGKAKKPHPFPERLVWDEASVPSLSGEPDDDDWEAHDRGGTPMKRGSKQRSVILSAFFARWIYAAWLMPAKCRLPPRSE
jgi:hypothetical protein